LLTLNSIFLPILISCAIYLKLIFIKKKLFENRVSVQNISGNIAKVETEKVIQDFSLKEFSMNDHSVIRREDQGCNIVSHNSDGALDSSKLAFPRFQPFVKLNEAQNLPA
jgi:hypothetical protein